jgi:phosphatidylinositol alpha-mannosyltransferase
MRIAIVAPYDLSRSGGVATHIRAQARALRTRGHAVEVFGPASGAVDAGETALGGSVAVTVGGTESGLGLSPRSARRARALFARPGFDVVHVHEPLTPLLPWLVLRCARAPVVGTFHVHRERGHVLYAIAKPVLRRLMRRVSCRIAVSEAARRTVAAHFPGTYDVVPNGIDLDAFQSAAPRPDTMPRGRPHVLFVGRLEPRKGVAHLIRAMAAVRRRVADARLTIVGDGPDRASLEALGQSLDVDAVFAGRVADAELPGYYQACDLLCSPALGGESFGLVLLEAMASSKPVVASRIDGYTALLERSGCATLVPPANVDATAEAIAALLDNAAVREVMGAQGADAARQYDWSEIAGRLERVYQRAAESHHAGDRSD